MRNTGRKLVDKKNIEDLLMLSTCQINNVGYFSDYTGGFERWKTLISVGWKIIFYHLKKVLGLWKSSAAHCLKVRCSLN